MTTLRRLAHILAHDLHAHRRRRPGARGMSAASERVAWAVDCLDVQAATGCSSSAAATASPSH